MRRGGICFYIVWPVKHPNKIKFEQRPEAGKARRKFCRAFRAEEGLQKTQGKRAAAEFEDEKEAKGAGLWEAKGQSRK